MELAIVVVLSIAGVIYYNYSKDVAKPGRRPASEGGSDNGSGHPGV